MFVILLSIIAAILSLLLYQQAGESCSVFILAILGLVYPDIGKIVAPSIILYFCMRRLLP